MWVYTVCCGVFCGCRFLWFVMRCVIFEWSFTRRKPELVLNSFPILWKDQWMKEIKKKREIHRKTTTLFKAPSDPPASKAKNSTRVEPKTAKASHGLHGVVALLDEASKLTNILMARSFSRAKNMNITPETSLLQKH